MKQKILFFMILMSGISLRSSSPDGGSPLRSSPLKAVTIQQVLQFNDGKIKFAKHDNGSIAAKLAARGVARMLEVIVKELQSSTSLDAWQELADGFVAKLPKAVGEPFYVAKYSEPLLTKPFCLIEEEITLQVYLQERVERLEHIDIACDDELVLEKKTRLLNFYQNVTDELKKQSDKVTEFDAARKKNNSLKEKVATHGGNLTIGMLKYLVAARNAVAAVTLIAGGVFVYWLWNRPSKRFDPGVVYCK